MDSDSDSGGSHISATPPRRSPSLPPPQQQSSPPPAAAAAAGRPTPFSTKKCKTKSRIKPKLSTSSRLILKPKLKKGRSSIPVPVSPQPDHSSHDQHDPFPPDPVPPSTQPISMNLPFQIRHHSSGDQSHYSGEALPAGRLFLSKFASFSKNPRPCLNLESTENYTSPHLHPSQSNPELETKAEPVHPETLPRVVKKHPNLIASSSDFTPPVKKPKCANEGNFVRLNINGYGRCKKFTYKSKKRNFKSFRRSKRKSKVVDDGEEVELCDEEGLVFEKREEMKTSAKLGVDLVSQIEEAVSSVRNEASDENLVKLLKLTHGFDKFRDGQLEAIKMVLAGKSVMLVLPTGAGKSLCYQLAALVLPGITLVVSPLIALMIDQLKQLPPVIAGGLLSSSQSREETQETLRLLQEGALKVLFVSPERFLNSEFTTIFSASALVSLAVIDEAHCISEWSHNFRPSYMRLRASLLRDSLSVKSILAMTATATRKTLDDVMSALEIPPSNLIQAAQLRDNFQLSVSLSTNRMKELIALLRSSPFAEIKSIIIYCKYQYETDTISKFLTDGNIMARSYHSGIPAKDRSRTQELFCSNKIRVVVATVAFGMGLDKKDVGAVIHYSLPESLEEYVQEIGRAGRDGRLSYCHLLFDDITYYKLRSLMYSDGLDEYAVNRFLSQVFCGDGFHGKVCSLAKESLSRKFDMKEEVMLTILTRLELGEVRYLQLLPQMNVTCSLNFHKTPPELLAAKDILVAVILKKSETKDGQYVFDIPNVANSIRAQTMEVTNQLQNLKLKGEVTYELKDPAYCYTLVNAPKDVCSLTADITRWLSEVEICKVRKLDAMFNAAVFAVKDCEMALGCYECQHTPCLQRKILEYFNAGDDNEVPNKMGQSSPFLRSDIKVFLQSNSHAKFTPRAIARIMHGIASPAFPSATWSRTHFWGRYVQIDFKVVMEAAKVELLNFVGKDAM